MEGDGKHKFTSLTHTLEDARTVASPTSLINREKFVWMDSFYPPFTDHSSFTPNATTISSRGAIFQSLFGFEFFAPPLPSNF